MLKENYEEVQKKITEGLQKSRTEPGGSYPDCGQQDKTVEMLSEIYDLGERQFR